MWEAYSGIALAIMAAGYVVGMLAERSRLERRQYDAEIAVYDRQLEDNEAARASHPIPPEAAELFEMIERMRAPAAELGIGQLGQPWAPSDPYADRPLWEYRSHRLWTDAASIMPVMLPRPPQTAAVTLTAPQRGRYPDTDTGMLGKLTDTGEIRALTDETDAAIAVMRADNDAWLDKWGAGAAV
jgi:hypothetical protein